MKPLITPEQTDLNQQLAQRLMQMVHVVGSTLNSSIRTTEQHFSPLMFKAMLLLEHNAATTQTELAEQLHISASTLSATVETLVKRGWLERKAGEVDRRVNHLHLTVSGLAIMQQMNVEAMKMFEGLFSPVNDEQKLELINSLEILIRLFQQGNRNKEDLNAETDQFCLPG